MADLRMPDLNRVLVAGRLTRDPELQHTGATGTPVCAMGLAVSRRYKVGEDVREETLFLDVTAWRGTGEWAGANLRKGDPVLVEGRLKQDEWEDKATGATRRKLTVTADRVHGLAWPASEYGKPTAPPQDSGPANGAGPGGSRDDLPF